MMDSQDNIKQIVREVSKATAAEIFRGLGVNINDADEVRRFQANMAWLFRFRRLSERVGTTVIITLVTLMTGGVLKGVWDSFKVKGGQ